MSDDNTHRPVKNSVTSHAKAFKTHSFRVPLQVFAMRKDDCVQPYHEREPASKAEEARRNRGRQLAARLAAGPMPLRILLDKAGSYLGLEWPGWTREGVEAVMSESPLWFKLVGWGLVVELTQRGRQDLLREKGAS